MEIKSHNHTGHYNIGACKIIIIKQTLISKLNVQNVDTIKIMYFLTIYTKNKNAALQHNKE